MRSTTMMRMCTRPKGGAIIIKNVTGSEMRRKSFSDDTNRMIHARTQNQFQQQRKLLLLLLAVAVMMMMMMMNGCDRLFTVTRTHTTTHTLIPALLSQREQWNIRFRSITRCSIATAERMCSNDDDDGEQLAFSYASGGETRSLLLLLLLL